MRVREIGRLTRVHHEVAEEEVDKLRTNNILIIIQMTSELRFQT